VIIDEGFGSLDKEGRSEMIPDLHSLTDVLKRIILVSHQEEFTESFKNGYAISLENGTSVAAAF
jgi:exonuclease SbcC